MSAPRILIPAFVLFGTAIFLATRSDDKPSGSLTPTPGDPEQGSSIQSGELAQAPPQSTPANPSPDDGNTGTPAEVSSTSEEPIEDAEEPNSTLPPPLPTERELQAEAFRAARGHLSVSELRIEQAALGKLIEQAKADAFALRFEQHNFDITYPGDPPSAPPPLGPGDRTMLTSVQTLLDEESGQPAAWVAKLPFDEYPELYAQLDEYDWLGEMIGN